MVWLYVVGCLCVVVGCLGVLNDGQHMCDGQHGCCMKHTTTQHTNNTTTQQHNTHKTQPPKTQHHTQPTQVLGKIKGSDLAGHTYTPLLPYFADLKQSGAFRVVADGYVTADSGTGVVHCAPAFGEDDYRVCLANGMFYYCVGVWCVCCQWYVLLLCGFALV